MPERLTDKTIQGKTSSQDIISSIKLLNFLEREIFNILYHSATSLTTADIRKEIINSVVWEVKKTDVSYQAPTDPLSWSLSTNFYAIHVLNKTKKIHIENARTQLIEVDKNEGLVGYHLTNRYNKILSGNKIETPSHQTIVKKISNLIELGFVISRKTDSKRESEYYALSPRIVSVIDEKIAQREEKQTQKLKGYFKR